MISQKEVPNSHKHFFLEITHKTTGPILAPRSSVGFRRERPPANRKMHIPGKVFMERKQLAISFRSQKPAKGLLTHKQSQGSSAFGVD